MADGESICKYLGLGVIIIVVVYVVSRSLNFQAKLVEGLTSEPITSVDNNEVPTNIASNNSSLEDTLLIEKYRTSYEDTIINLEKNVSLKILELVTVNANSISQDASSADAQDKITLANNLQQFKATLNSTMLFMDGMKSTGKFGLF